ncbi:MAG: hypothetical protein JWM40_1603, partial [Frankiales bacterium]|nr:hypothetical protein [Frankiales bacterium]
VLAGLALGAGVAFLVQLLAGPLTTVLSKLGEGRLRRLLVVGA